MGAYADLPDEADLPARRALPKPVKGTARAEKVRRVKAAEGYEREQKAIAKARDGYTCRWPGCDWKARRDRLESAHLVNKSQGGSDDAANLVTVCLSHHQGRPSLHSGDLKILAPSLDGTNGPLEFWQQDARGWYIVGSEYAVGRVARD